MRNKGFTLVELAIVIVIIGLLVGGVLQGQELIKQAQWRSSVKEIEGYKGAMATFFAKYNCLPGDCINAFTFFGSECGTNVAMGSSGASRYGCNGNGNKELTYAEGQLMWKHLSLGKMIKGSFTESFALPVKVNVNVPPSSLGTNAGISGHYSQGDPSTDTGCDYQYCPGVNNSVRGGITGRNIFVIGSVIGANSYIRGALITPMEAYEFDVKFDDGKYNSGDISGAQSATVIDNTVLHCGNNANQTYLNTDPVAQNDMRCRIVFNSGF